MKRFAVFTALFILMAAAFPALAQQNDPDVITLNDATPAIDVAITLPVNATGTIALELVQASAKVTDSNDAVVFYAADERLHGLEFNLAPNSGSHMLTVERLPGVTEAYVKVTSLSDMTRNGTVTFVENTNTVSLNQEVALTLSGEQPGGTVDVSIPQDTTGVVTATFPGAYATTQLVDKSGAVLAESTGGHVDGVTFVLDGGAYDFTLLGSGLTDSVVAGVRVVSVQEGGFTVLEAPTTPQNEVVVSNSNNATEPACTATVFASSANLRSGPGTGYSILGYAYRGETYTIGGRNQEGTWIVVGTSDGNSAWMAVNATLIRGACAQVPVFDTPTQDAAPAQLSITGSNGNTQSVSNGDDDHHETSEHETSEHEEHEEHDDD